MTTQILEAVAAEREAQDEKWGEQNHPSSFGEDFRQRYAANALYYQQINDARAIDGTSSWDGILLEEVYEAVSEPDLHLRRVELIQVAAVAVSEIESIDRLLASSESPYAETPADNPEESESDPNESVADFIVRSSTEVAA